MKTIKCPLCQKETFNLRKKKCVNLECDLQHAKYARDIEKQPFSWNNLWWKIYYLRPRDIARYLRNLFITRHDLVRTGLSKTNWMDVDHKMFCAMLSLVESFVIGEEGIYFVDAVQDDNALRDQSNHQNATSTKILKLYVDYKVTYPYMCSKLYEMLMDDDMSSEAYFAYEEEVYEYENKLMRRTINLRKAMWT